MLNLQKIGPFGGPIGTLVLQINRWEQGVRDEFNKLWSKTSRPWNVRVGQALSYEAQPSDWVQMDCSAAVNTVWLPSPTPVLRGAEIMCHRYASSGSYALRVKPRSGLINGTTHVDRTSANAWAWCVCFGDQWWAIT